MNVPQILKVWCPLHCSYPLSKVTEEAEVLRTVLAVVRDVLIQQRKQHVQKTVQTSVMEVQSTLQGLLQDGGHHDTDLPNAAFQQTDPTERESHVLHQIQPLTCECFVNPTPIFYILHECVVGDAGCWHI